MGHKLAGGVADERKYLMFPWSVFVMLCGTSPWKKIGLVVSFVRLFCLFVVLFSGFVFLFCFLFCFFVFFNFFYIFIICLNYEVC